jgi:iron complex transport system ATP-binding protein
MDVVIEVKNAEFGYFGGSNVFEGARCLVKEGEILSILGPNGSGKTTLLKCMNGLFKLRKGQVYIEGKRLSSLKREQVGKKVGYVPQAHVSTFPYTVLEMVLMGRAPHLGVFSSPSAKDVEIAKEAIEMLGISHLMDRPYSQTSGGEAQLVIIARALAAEPKALLLDEPTSHLDVRNQMVILNFLEELAREKGIAAIMTTHFPDHALSISDKVLLMNGEKTSMVGNVEDVITEYNLKKVYGIDTRIISVKDGRNNTKVVVPLRKSFEYRQNGRSICNE